SRIKYISRKETLATMPGSLRLFVLFAAPLLLQTDLYAWNSGELLIWMDIARAHGLH
ncbi:MAG: hypothetical protein JO298_11530, partial [Verrucomicrobia bacterium]|nr:hypothetical protein [Verrucomicrobiota bacterium]